MTAEYVRRSQSAATKNNPMPNPWPLVPLGEVLTERQEVPSSEALIRGEIPIVAKVGFNDGQLQLRTTTQTKTGMILVRPGDLLVSGINAAKGAIAVYGIENEKPIAATIHYGAYIPNKERSDVRYLWWLLRSKTFRELLLEYVPGGIKTELKAKRLLPVPIPLPPLAEQRRIVARIEALAAKIQEAQRIRQRAAAQTDNICAATLHRIGQEMARNVRKLGEGVVSAKNGLSRRPIGIEAGPIVLRLADVSGGHVDVTNARHGSLSDKELESYGLSEGDLLFVRVNGSREIVGRCIPFQGADQAVCFNDHLIRVRLNPDVLDCRYVSAMANGPLAREYIENAAITTAGQFTINHAMLVALPIPLPSLNEQRRIVAYLDALQAKVDALTRLQAETAAELDALLPSILDRAFRAEL